MCMGIASKSLTSANILKVQTSLTAMNEPKNIPVGTTVAESVVTASFTVEDSSDVVSPLSVGVLTEITL